MKGLYKCLLLVAVELADKDGRSDTFAIRRQMPALESICRFLSRKEQYSSWSTWRTFSMGQSMQSRHIWNFLQFQFESFVPAARSNLCGRERETYFPMKGWNPPKWLRMSWSNISLGGNRNIEMGLKTFSILKAKYKVRDAETRAWILEKIVWGYLWWKPGANMEDAMDVTYPKTDFILGTYLCQFFALGHFFGWRVVSIPWVVDCGSSRRQPGNNNGRRSGLETGSN